MKDKFSNKKKILIMFICAVLIMMIYGCTFSSGEKTDTTENHVESTTEVSEEKTEDELAQNSPNSSEENLTVNPIESIDSSENKNIAEDNTESVKEDIEDSSDNSEASNNTASVDTKENNKSDNDQSVGNHTDFPAYSGEAFIEVSGNIPDFTEEEKKSKNAFEDYSELDELGRCGVAFANICPELMPDEERGDIGDVRPSGWDTVKYPEVIEDNYLYNRSHLIAYSLAGENANEKNLITGTRFLNQNTMQIYELKVLDYVRSTGNHVLYRVTPVFDGDNLVASGVQMEAWSVEDEGDGICYNVFCYNVQPGIDIDYATGKSQLSEEGSTKTADNTTEETADKTIDLTTDEAADNSSGLASDQSDKSLPESSVSKAEQETRDFIVNTNTGKFHVPTCSSVDDMADKNKMEYTGTIEELKEKGYTPCGRCLAEYR